MMYPTHTQCGYYCLTCNTQFTQDTKRYKNGGVCIYIHESLQFSNINVYKFCKEKDFEACVIKLYLSCYAIGIVSIYRSPSGNFEYFLDKLEALLNFVKDNSMELILCGDYNINFFK